MTETSTRGALSADDAAKVFVSSWAYADDDYFHDACAVLRRDRPIAEVTDPAFPPFWAVTKHADVFDISKNNRVWLNAPRAVLQTLAQEHTQSQGAAPASLVNIDDPRHRELRGVTADWFTPKSLAKLDDRLKVLAQRAVDRLREAGPECDFAQEVATPYPLEVILSILGLPEADYPLMLKLTRGVFGAEDSEYSHNEDADTSSQAAIMEFIAYFTDLVGKRRAEPTDDLASVIANATVNAEPIEAAEQLFYYIIIATAGHDTTSHSISGGMRALAENPLELQRLRDDLGVVKTATEEIIRWVSPVKSFLRTAGETVTVRDHTFAAGDTVLLSYPSANRDEDIFVEPNRFDVGREPNKHLAFGFGAHHCLGAMLARMEIRALLNELVPVLDHLELAGTPELSKTLFVGGLKHLPVRYSIR